MASLLQNNDVACYSTGTLWNQHCNCYIHETFLHTNIYLKKIKCCHNNYIQCVQYLRVMSVMCSCSAISLVVYWTTVSLWKQGIPVFKAKLWFTILLRILPNNYTLQSLQVTRKPYYQTNDNSRQNNVGHTITDRLFKIHCIKAIQVKFIVKEKKYFCMRKNRRRHIMSPVFFRPVIFPALL